MKNYPEDDEDDLASEAMTAQLRVVITKELVETEVLVLSEVDEIVYSHERTSQIKPLAFWVCIYNLIFIYHSLIIYANSWGKFWLDPPSNANHLRIGGTSSELIPNIDLARHIYNKLVSIYSAPYKRLRLRLWTGVAMKWPKCLAETRG
jgi:hypothetical protein